MSGALLTEKELDNIKASYANYGEKHLDDYIRSIWKEAWEEAHDIGYKLGVIEGFNMINRGKR
jgi:hypothetical protein